METLTPAIIIALISGVGGLLVGFGSLASSMSTGKVAARKNDIDTLQLAITTLKDENRRKSEENLRMLTRIDELETDIQAVHKDLREKDIENTRLAIKVDLLQAEVSKRDARITELENQIESLEARLSQYEQVKPITERGKARKKDNK